MIAKHAANYMAGVLLAVTIKCRDQTPKHLAAMAVLSFVSLLHLSDTSRISRIRPAAKTVPVLKQSERCLHTLSTAWSTGKEDAGSDNQNLHHLRRNVDGPAIRLGVASIAEK